MDTRSDPHVFEGPICPTAVVIDGSTVHPTFSQTRPMARGIGLSALPRAPPPVVPAAPVPSPPKRSRKDRGPNWLPQEIAALIAAKREMYLQELDTVDGRDLMIPDSSKWIRVSHFVNNSGYSPIHRDGPACKTKWNQMIPDYKKIADYFSRTGRNIPDYWDLSPVERKAEGLPRVFALDVYEAIHEWYGSRPMIQPPHVRDMLAPNDGNYRPPQSQSQHEIDGDSEPDTEDPMDYPPPDNVQGTDDTTPPRSPLMTSSTPSRVAGPNEPVGTPNSRPYNGLPPGITPHYISSSETSYFPAQRRPGNTAVKRKSVSGHAIIADATKATGVVMAQQMQDIADASRELERSKIEVQLKLFSEQMAYQREKDLRLYENAAIANDNARLSIIKQGEMVACLSQLSNVLSNSLSVNKDFMYPPGPQSAPEMVKQNTSGNDFYAGGQQNMNPAHSTGLLHTAFRPSGHPNTLPQYGNRYPCIPSAFLSTAGGPCAGTASPEDRPNKVHRPCPITATDSQMGTLIPETADTAPSSSGLTAVPTVNSELPTLNSARPTLNSARPTLNSARPTLNSIHTETQTE